MKRIRYVRFAGEPGAFISLRAMSDRNGVQYQTVIQEGGKTGYLVELPYGDIVERVSGTSPHKVKIALRDALQKRGVIFEEESRSGSNIETYIGGAKDTSDEPSEVG